MQRKLEHKLETPKQLNKTHSQIQTISQVITQVQQRHGNRDNLHPPPHCDTT